MNTREEYARKEAEKLVVDLLLCPDDGSWMGVIEKHYLAALTAQAEASRGRVSEAWWDGDGKGEEIDAVLSACSSAAPQIPLPTDGELQARHPELDESGRKGLMLALAMKRAAEPEEDAEDVNWRAVELADGK